MRVEDRVEEHVLEKLFPEVVARLCMMDEDFEYEVKVPRPEYFLSIAGGGKNPEFALTPVAVDADGSRHEGESIVFVMYGSSQKKCNMLGLTRS
jgi:hypothetical protein